LESAEERALQVTTDRAQLEDGHRILELGCGWGSLTLWMGEQFPNSPIVAVSNSAAQRGYILEQAVRRGLKNIDVVTADIAEFSPSERFDRVVSVEMFEHVRNHRVLMDRIYDWLTPAGKLFVHIFCHRAYTYLFEDRGPNDWMAREFFTGGIMPSYDLLPQSAGRLALAERWKVSGTHYQATSEAWLKNLDAAEEAVEAIVSQEKERPDVYIQRWRIFFMACAELFGFEQGDQWHVGHYLFAR
jgi:cyclopropane-fatty-acyl-phospholipid synthase